MTCDRYWNEGVDLVEAGAADPHLASCAECQRAHAGHCELVELVARVSECAPSRAGWEADVWRTLARDVPHRRWQPHVAGALVAACTLLIVWLDREPTRRPPVEIVRGEVARRAAVRGTTSATIGDMVRIAADAGHEIWLYREERLVVRCTPELATTHCAPDAVGAVGELTFEVPGEYQIVTVASSRRPAGTLDHDLAALLAGNVAFELRRVTVR